MLVDFASFILIQNESLLLESPQAQDNNENSLHLKAQAMAKNNTLRELSNAMDDEKNCEHLDETRHLLLQISNVCYVAAFLVPHKFQYATLAMRILLSVGFLLGSVWGGLLVCSPDILAWNLLLFLLNLGHAGYILYKHFPPRINHELLDLYAKVFHPVKVKKKHFKELVRDADVQTLERDEHYAMEGITAADQRLSILISGRMKATCEDVLLHYIMPFEFVDSPEWEACRTDKDKLFQVTLTAIERCRVLTWRRQSLEELLKTNRFLDVVIYNLIGKDITHKLYSLNEQHKSDQNKFTSTALPELWREHQMSKSLSADAVHTGIKGRMRSITWREHDTKTSVARSGSLNSVAGNQRHSVRYSDPGPERSPNKQPHRPTPQFDKEFTLEISAKLKSDQRKFYKNKLVIGTEAEEDAY